MKMVYTNDKRILHSPDQRTELVYVNDALLNQHAARSRAFPGVHPSHLPMLKRATADRAVMAGLYPDVQLAVRLYA